MVRAHVVLAAQDLGFLLLFALVICSPRSLALFKDLAALQAATAHDPSASPTAAAASSSSSWCCCCCKWLEGCFLSPLDPRARVVVMKHVRLMGGVLPRLFAMLLLAVLQVLEPVNLQRQPALNPRTQTWLH